MKENQRVILTKKILKDTLLKMLKKSDIDHISVKALCEEAQINRSTFYRHYESQYALMDDLVNDYVRLIAECNETVSDNVSKTDGAVENVIRYLYRHPEMGNLMVQSPDFINKLFFQLKGIPESNMQSALKNKRISGDTSDYIKSFALSGSCAIIYKWVTSGMKDSPEVISELILELSRKCFR